MNYKKINLFGNTSSRGTYDDFFDIKKYNSLQEAYASNDYVECDFVLDDNNVIFIEARHAQIPEIKKYHRLEYQRCFFGLDIIDDNAGIDLATSLFL